MSSDKIDNVTAVMTQMKFVTLAALEVERAEERNDAEELKRAKAFLLFQQNLLKEFLLMGDRS